MKEMMLLGAGASVEAGVPSAYKMTEAIANRFRSDIADPTYSQVISFVIGGLLFEAGKNGQDPLTAGVNVEDLFNAVQLLAERHSLEAAPFVGSWHAMVDEFDKVQPSRSSTRSLGKIIYKLVSSEIRKAFEQSSSSIDAGKIDKALTNSLNKAFEAAKKGRNPSFSSSDSIGKAVEQHLKDTSKKWSNALKSASPSSGSDFDAEISKLVDSRQAQPGEGRIFYRTNERMIAALKQLVWVSNSKSVEYLNPILNLSKRQGRLVIATLNYDNAVETLFGSQNLVCDTGLDCWSNTGNFDFSKNDVSLLKLHGSIDWAWHPNTQSLDRPMPHSIIRRISPEDMAIIYDRPAVIFGQRNKLTAEGPFLDLLRAFREELSSSQCLTVVGYPFRDPHINVYISQWLNSNKNNVIRIINGPRFQNEPADYVQHLLHLQSVSPVQVNIIPVYAGQGLRELYGVYVGSFDNTIVNEAPGLDDNELLE